MACKMVLQHATSKTSGKEKMQKDAIARNHAAVMKAIGKFPTREFQTVTVILSLQLMTCEDGLSEERKVIEQVKQQLELSPRMAHMYWGMR